MSTSRFHFILAVAAVSALALAGAALAAAPKNGSFKTPSGNIVCGYAGSLIECGIKSGLRPAPKNTCTDIDYSGKRVSLSATGRARPVVCAGDPGPFLVAKTAPVLGYGKTWRGRGIACTSRRAGLTCKNRKGHGFFLSRAHWRSF
jgi:hypothetical protein